MGETARVGRSAAKLPPAISNAISGIHREHYGRGASRARTVMGADYIICFLEDIYTPVERTLIDGGRFEAVRETRDAFQDTMQKTFTAAVEELSGRKVIGFLRRCTSIRTSRSRRSSSSPRTTANRWSASLWTATSRTSPSPGGDSRTRPR